MAEHRVELVKLGDPALERLHRRLPAPAATSAIFRLAVRQEFVERRIEQPDGHRQRRHDPEDLLEIAALGGEELEEGGAAAGFVLGQDHLADVGDALGIEEHVLGAAQADPFGAELAGGPAVERGLGVGPDPKAAVGVGPGHQGSEIADQLGLDGGDGAEHDLAGRAVDGDRLPFPHLDPADPHPPGAL